MYVAWYESIGGAWSLDDLDTLIAMQQGCMTRKVMVQCQRIEGPMRDCAVEVTRAVFPLLPAVPG